jgi:hypothetical protein
LVLTKRRADRPRITAMAHHRKRKSRR